ncbi:hypothetical protein ADK77_29185 [Streptomyces antibioticus]|nr:hypothetical protein ADK77_29185 [Streptomyces antibioticus]
MSEADDVAGEFQEALVEVGTAFVAGAQSYQLVEPGEGALDDPADLVRAGSVGDAASGDESSMPRCHSRRRCL